VALEVAEERRIDISRFRELGDIEGQNQYPAIV